MVVANQSIKPERLRPLAITTKVARLTRVFQALEYLVISFQLTTCRASISDTASKHTVVASTILPPNTHRHRLSNTRPIKVYSLRVSLPISPRAVLAQPATSSLWVTPGLYR
ncbi:hypothetical protein D3C78_1501210 [compost metagenome]